jgi:hypothetical protein
MYAMFWDRKGSDSFELAVFKGRPERKRHVADFQILRNGVLGWAFNSCLPLVEISALIGYCIEPRSSSS